MRENLKNARKKMGMTQQKMASYLGICERYYKALESGEKLGAIEFWDRLEDLFKIHQRKLRELSGNHPDQEENR